jgi:drug/metabolite transporter (DMT)-like permease
MSYLLLSILSSSMLFVIFKITEQLKANLINLITINYLVATILGFSFNHYHTSVSSLFASNWILYALLIGILFVLTFLLIGYSTRLSGITVTSIATKLSVVVPILFSILYFKEKSGIFKISGLILAVIAVILTNYRSINKAKNIKLILLPIAIFIGAGISDSTVKYTQTHFINNQMSLLFSSVVFLFSLIAGLLLILFRRKLSTSGKIALVEILSGTILGIANFGSLYFFILALNNCRFDSSVIFGLNSICIVLLSVFSGVVFFKEKLSTINFAGVMIALIAILLLMYF